MRTQREYLPEVGRTLYPVDFTLGYLDREHIKVFVDEDNPDNELSYTWVNDNQIQLSEPFTADKMYIRRIVPKSTLWVQFNDGARLTEKNLDDANRQCLMAVEEVLDGFFDSAVIDYLESLVDSAKQEADKAENEANKAANSAASAAESAAIAQEYSKEGLLAAALAAPDSTVSVGGVPAGRLAKAAIQVTPEEFGAVPDGAFDCTAAFNTMGEYIKGTEKKILLTGTYRIDGVVKLYNDIDCFGEVHLYGSARFDILRESQGIVIDATPYMANLVKDSLSIGVPNIAGHTVSLRSTEVMIKRFGFTHNYSKEEVFKAESANGLGWPRLDCTYLDAAQLTMTAYPPEKPLTINGLKIRGYQTTLHADLVYLRRSNVTFNDFDLDVEGVSRTNARVGIDIRDSVDVIFNSPKVHGIAHQEINGSWLGYGIYLQRTANVFINNANSNECKHNLAARHDKDTFINGGWWRSSNGSSSPLDSHWTNGFYVDGATIYARGGNALGICGSNVTLKNSTVYDGRRLVGVRIDTPELGGIVVIDDNTWYNHPTADDQSFYGTASVGEEYGNFFERELKQPDYLSIKQNKIHNRWSGEIGYLRLHTRNWARTAIGFIDIDDNKFISGGKSSGLASGRANVIIYPAMSIPAGARIRVSNEVWERSNGNFKIRNDKGHLENLFDIEFNNVKNLCFHVDVDIASSFQVNGGSVAYFKAASSVPSEDAFKAVTYWVDLNNVTFLNAWSYYATAPRLKARGSYFESDTLHNKNDFVPGGNIQLNSNNMKDAFDLSMSNACSESCDLSRLPQLDGWTTGSKHSFSICPEKNGADFTHPELGEKGVGVRSDTQELQVAVEGVVYKAPMAFHNYYAPFFNGINTYGQLSSNPFVFSDDPVIHFRIRTGNYVPRPDGNPKTIIGCTNTTVTSQRQFIFYVNGTGRISAQLGGVYTASADPIMPNTVYEFHYESGVMIIRANAVIIRQQNIVFGEDREPSAPVTVGAQLDGAGGLRDRYEGELLDFDVLTTGIYWPMSSKNQTVQPSMPAGNNMVLHNFGPDLWRLL